MTSDRFGLRATPADLAARYRAEGWWTDDTLGSLVTAGTAAAGDRACVFHSAVRPWRGTVAGLDRAARRLAGALRARGFRAGDVLAFQLPNWAEAGMAFWAGAYLGAVVVPIVHFYGPKEVDHILRVTRPAVFVTADRFGRTDFLAADDRLPSLPDDVLRVVLRTGPGPLPAGAVDLDDLLGTGDPLPGATRVDPDAPAVLAFTSGTTRDPKGVVHSHRTLTAEVRQIVSMSHPRPALSGAPVGHFMGMLTAFLLPLVSPRPVHLVDTWAPDRVLEIMLAERVGPTGGATYFLTSLLDQPGFSPEHLALIPDVTLGGAPIPGPVAHRAEDLGIRLSRAYGSTEHPTVTGSTGDVPAAQRLGTDGVPLPGVELRLDEQGQILTRGPDLFVGYTDPDLTAGVVDADGWYHTGDIGVIDGRGALAITDRLADVIIRGGENISAAEVEEILASLPAVAEAGVVAAPDERLGERPAAVLRLRPGAPEPSLEDVRTHLAAAGLARQKWPESLHLVAEFPRTSTGKIQKFELRRLLREGGLPPE